MQIPDEELVGLHDAQTVMLPCLLFLLLHGVIRHPQGLPIVRMDSRVKHGNDREWRGVMPPCVLFKLLHGVIRHPWGFRTRMDSRV
ncbi:MAG: hypothetical protein ISR54_04510 [Chlorobium phaeobacteroides]|nr:hypothetical protein [Chlorobium phaeobacteroides]